MMTLLEMERILWWELLLLHLLALLLMLLLLMKLLQLLEMSLLHLLSLLLSRRGNRSLRSSREPLCLVLWFVVLVSAATGIDVILWEAILCVPCIAAGICCTTF